MTEAHTYNHDHASGRLNLVGQIKPLYLLDAIENADQAWEAHDALVDQEAEKGLIAFALCNAKAGDTIVGFAYNRWHCETGGHLPAERAA